jgi:hypothetical protein
MSLINNTGGRDALAIELCLQAARLQPSISVVERVERCQRAWLQFSRRIFHGCVREDSRRALVTEFYSLDAATFEQQNANGGSWACELTV